MTRAPISDDPSLTWAIGNERSFAALLTHYHHRIFSHAWRILGDATEAEDITQDVFLKLWTGKAKFDPQRGAFLPWMLRITTNACIDNRRRLKSVDALEDAELIDDSSIDPDAHLEAHAIQTVIQALPYRQRAAIALFYIEGFSMAEIADTLNAPPKAVEGLLSRGRLALRAALADLAREKGIPARIAP